MDQPKFSLGPWVSSSSDRTNSSSSESEANNRKRKLNTQTSIDLHLHNPLLLNGEQCLGLPYGRMSYLNKKTHKKSLLKPKEQKLGLDLNKPNAPISANNKVCSPTKEDTKKKRGCSKGGSAMATIVCLNCHLLVMLYQSSPSCPNCKYMNLLLQPPAPKNEIFKSLEPLSLLH